MRQKITESYALKISRELQTPVAFDDREGAGAYGVAWPCGCVDFDTVLSDNSIGLGEWTELCPLHFWESR
jgi:hypothetical protein